MPKAISFGLSIYTPEFATAAVLEWCSKATFFYMVWMDQEEPNYVYTADVISSYVPGSAWSLGPSSWHRWSLALHLRGLCRLTP